MLEIRSQYADWLVELAEDAVMTGAPINRPIWWVDPKDQEALKIDSEFMFGDRVLVAPVLEEEKTSRDVYLPKGTWMLEGKEDKVYKGPVWLRDFPADLKTLPFFTLIKEEFNDVAVDVLN